MLLLLAGFFFAAAPSRARSGEEAELEKIGREAQSHIDRVRGGKPAEEQPGPKTAEAPAAREEEKSTLKLEDDPNYQRFIGKWPNKYFNDRPDLCRILKERVLRFNKVNFDLPKFKGRQMESQPGGYWGPTEGTPFEAVLIAAVAPKDQNRNLFVRMTREPPGDGDSRGYEDRLKESILSSEGNLSPAIVMEMALQATRGNYPLAALTAHNLLKEITYEGRTASRRIAGVMKAQKKRVDFPSEYSDVPAKLINLRAAPGDKMGIWYHLFVPLTITAWSNPDNADGAIRAEYLARSSFIRTLGIKMGSPADTEKKTSDLCFAAAAREIYDLAKNPEQAANEVPAPAQKPPVEEDDDDKRRMPASPGVAAQARKLAFSAMSSPTNAANYDQRLSIFRSYFYSLNPVDRKSMYGHSGFGAIEKALREEKANAYPALDRLLTRLQLTFH